MVLIWSSEDPITKALGEKLSQRTGCKARQLGPGLQGDVEGMMEARGLVWKEVAFMGKRGSTRTRRIGNETEDGLITEKKFPGRTSDGYRRAEVNSIHTGLNLNSWQHQIHLP